MTIASPRTKYVLHLLSCRLSGKSFPLFLELYFIGSFFKSMDKRKNFCHFFLDKQIVWLTLYNIHFHIMLEYSDSLIHILSKFSLPVHYGQKDLHSAKSEADISCLFVKILQIMYSTCSAAQSSTDSGTDFKYS